MFAVAVPAYNAEATLAEAIESVLAQTCSDWELVILDNGSSDGTLDIGRRYADVDSRIRVSRVESNVGCGPGRAQAIALTNAKYIVHFDSDDVLLPACLETYARLIDRHPERELYSCNAVWFAEDGSEGPFYTEPGFDQQRSFSLEEMLRHNAILSAAAVVARAAYERVGGIRPDSEVEDYDLWLRVMATGGSHLYTPDVLVRYRRSSAQMSLASPKMLEGSAEALRHLAATVQLDEATKGRALAAAAEYGREAEWARHIPDRERLEQRLLAGDLRNARRDYVETRPAYQSYAKYLIGLAAVTLSPRLYASLLRRRHGQGRT